MNQQENDFVFGLDIGTRNVVGTVGRLQEDGFHVVAQCTREHETRAMIDGQIHNISRVGKVVQEVKECLEAQMEMPLKNVCIAAAGRVLRTVTTRVKYEFPEETVVSGEDLHTLNLLGVDKAQQELKEEDEENKKYKFFCVGYSVMHYYLNGDLFTSLEGHKADSIEEDIIVTFLPEDVVDGLYSAVEQAGLQVANLTLEPIAAINVAIPQNFRMLNIALIDVGAGTSDICITKEGSIAAYGMIPYAGDELTEVIVQEYLVDFATAEQIKKDSTEKKEIVFEDIMGISHTIPAEQVWKLTEPVRNKITKAVAEKIKELNGDVSVAAAFVVGGGGKIKGFCESLAKDLGIVEERVALRGEEVMKDVTFEQGDIKKDPLLVTPIGICLNYYEQKNNFIVIHFNDEMMKLYDNGHLTVVDAALQAGYSTEELFPRRGKDIHFTVNGTHRMIRGEQGESAIVRMNDEVVGMNTPLLSNCRIEIQASTAGGRAVRTIESLDEYTSDTVTFIVNRHYVTCPKFVEVNGSLEPGSYEIQENDAIETRNYYTLGQLREFMDVELDPDGEIMVNNRPASMETLVYENFNIEWTTIGYADMDATYKKVEESPIAVAEKEAFEKQFKDLQDAEDIVEVEDDADAENEQEETVSEEAEETEETTVVEDVKNPQDGIDIKINGENFKLQNKEKYIFVDIFNVIDFDINAGGGRRVVTNLNGQKCGYSSELNDGDQIEIYWKES
ncbi:MAG: rod shape-determining protein [Lachnospiraceae bacterium]|nr:rod shape-determining protein [Lachnospiraceae bacterium]